jgi:hypothetical protein
LKTVFVACPRRSRRSPEPGSSYVKHPSSTGHWPGDGVARASGRAHCSASLRCAHCSASLRGARRATAFPPRSSQAPRSSVQAAAAPLLSCAVLHRAGCQVAECVAMRISGRARGSYQSMVSDECFSHYGEHDRGCRITMRWTGYECVGANRARCLAIAGGADRGELRSNDAAVGVPAVGRHPVGVWSSLAFPRARRAATLAPGAAATRPCRRKAPGESCTSKASR